MISPKQWSESSKKSFCVLGAGSLAMPIALGAVYSTDKFLPRQMDWLKETVAKHLVEPHIEIFDKLTRNLKKAHDRYDEQKEAFLKAQGKPYQQEAREGAHQRAIDIAGKIITFSTALAVDGAASYLIQKKLNKVLGVCTQPCRTCFAEAGVQLLLTAAMPTVFATASENLHHSISRMVNKTAGADKKVADDIGISATYVAFPGLVAAVAALASGHNVFRSRS